MTVKIAASRLSDGPLSMLNNIPYNGGKIITTPRIRVMFCGAWWRKHEQICLKAHLMWFWKSIIDSDYIDQLSKEYSTPEYKITRGNVVKAAIINELDAPLVSDEDIRNKLIGLNNTDPRFQLDKPFLDNMLYVFYTPPGTQVVMDGDKSCERWCGYHDVVFHSSQNIYYAVIPWIDCPGCMEQEKAKSVFQAITVVSSHELAEWITDPVPGTGWYSEYLYEIGDVCEAATEHINTGTYFDYLVQKEWSNAAKRCV